MVGSGKRWRALLGLVATLGLLAVGAVPASAAEDNTPADVIAAFSVDTAVVLGSDEAAGLGRLAEAASFGTVHRVHAWSASLIAGKASDPVSAMDEWVAPILTASGEAVGVYRVWRETPDSDARFAGVDGDAATAAALAEVAAGVMLIEDPTIAAWYTLDAGVVTPVGSARFDDIRVATPIDRVAEIVSARFAQNVRDAAPPVGLSYESWMWAGIALLVTAAIGAGLVMLRRRLPA
ncbi:hypothetical protein ACIGEP_02275 [Microbacterium sp. NPDC077663]|uniref:hypothetical protein n=1 Tax=Microbacterium sp. NPDC077663 TaxID=3364189 RepID=UPI0037CC1059